MRKIGLVSRGLVVLLLLLLLSRSLTLPPQSDLFARCLGQCDVLLLTVAHALSRPRVVRAHTGEATGVGFGEFKPPLASRGTHGNCAKPLRKILGVPPPPRARRPRNVDRHQSPQIAKNNLRPKCIFARFARK
jgi:hypothetical protein